MLIRIRIPDENQKRYLRGGCFAFACELRRYVKSRSGMTLPLRGIWVDGVPEHAFLTDMNGMKAYDARGEMPLDLAIISNGASFEGTGSIGPMTMAMMKRWSRNMDGFNARMDIARYVYLYQDDE